MNEFFLFINFYRILQKFFPKANQHEIEVILSKIGNDIVELMLDPYANYMFQTLVQSCSSEQRYYLLEKVSIVFIERVKLIIRLLQLW